MEMIQSSIRDALNKPGITRTSKAMATGGTTIRNAKHLKHQMDGRKSHSWLAQMGAKHIIKMQNSCLCSLEGTTRKEHLKFSYAAGRCIDCSIHFLRVATDE